MPSPVPESTERAALERLRMLRVAKDLFLSEWYQESCRTLAFSAEACQTLDEVSRESAAEREEAFDLIVRWARKLDASPMSEAPDHVAHVSRRDFLLHLIDAKEAAGETFERAALLAPPGMREDFERLAAIDFRHALTLRQLLVEEVQMAWRTRLRDGRRPG